MNVIRSIVPRDMTPALRTLQLRWLSSAAFDDERRYMTQSAVYGTALTEFTGYLPRMSGRPWVSGV